MPKIYPMHVDVQWPENEGALGIVGIAPWATVKFLATIYSLVQAVKDWDFPRVLVDANSKIPSRGRYFDLNETDPSPFIADTIDELLVAGATVVVVPCNTAHVLFDKWSVRASSKIVSIIDATLEAIKPSSDSKIAVLGSTHLVRHGTYSRPLVRKGLVPVTPTQGQQALIDCVISEIKTNNELKPETGLNLVQLFRDLNAANISEFILGCTELTQAMECIPRDLFEGNVVDSNVELAKAALKKL